MVFLAACGGGGGGGGGGTSGSPTDFTVGGTVSGLAASATLTMQNNAGDDLVLSTNGIFTFATALSNGSNYDVQILNQPVGQTCSVSNNTGDISNANITSIAVSCSTTTYTVGGALSGLAQGGVESITLQNNGSDDLVLSGNGLFVFTTALADGAAYNVQITAQPAGKSCAPANNTGAVSGSNVSNINIVCSVNTVSGSLDLSFNPLGAVAGIVTEDELTGFPINTSAIASMIDANGNILVTGHLGSDMAIWRLNPDGSNDSSFNPSGANPGLVTHDGAAGGTGLDQGRAITVDANGRILVTGISRSAANFDMVIWRYNSDGSPDTSFNSTGFVVSAGAAGGNGNDQSDDILIDANGRILVVGGGASISNNAYFDLVIWRYNDDGTLDTSFNPQALDSGGNIGAGTQGISSYNGSAMGVGSESGSAIAIDSNNKILVAGIQENDTGFSLALWRYNTNGTLDTGFNPPGSVVPGRLALVLGTHTVDSINDMTIDSSQRIVMTGSGGLAPVDSRDMILLRVNPDGSLDNSFNAADTPGYVIHDGAAGGTGTDGGNALALDTSGRIVVAGTSPNVSGDFDMVLWRFNSDGTFDTTFNSSGPSPGIVTHHNAAGGGDNDFGDHMSIDGSGRIVVVGTSVRSLNPFPVGDMTVWRYLP